jgi:ankyrin repeat protein
LLGQLLSKTPEDPKQQAVRQLEAAGMPVTADGFVRAVATGHQPLIDLFIAAGIPVNAAAEDQRTPLLAAALAKDWPLVDRFVAMGADVNRPDAHGLTPLMAAALADHVSTVKSLLARGAAIDAVDEHLHSALHYAVANRSLGSERALLEAGANCTGECCKGRTVLAHAADVGDWGLFEPILLRQPARQLSWGSYTRQELQKALVATDAAKTTLLLSKHAGPPTPEGSAQPLLAHAILGGDLRQFQFLLDFGADPNTPLNSPVEKGFCQRVSQNFLRHYLDTEEGMTVLMLAAGMGKPDFVRALIDRGASRGIGTKTYKMPALLFATRNENVEITQMLIANSPKPEDLRIQISLGSQQASIIKSGIPVYRTTVSTGRAGFSTPTGNFVVTDKHAMHMSTIYKVKMPFFMRLNGRDFGMHEGVVPGYPASHGCIRLPGDMARKLYKEIPLGTLVSITN